MGEPDLETAANPLAPTTIVAAFTEALHGLKGDRRIKLAILKELNQTSFGDIAAIYADVNRHLEGMNVVPQLRPAAVQRGARRASAVAAPTARRRSGRRRRRSRRAARST